MHCQTRSQNVCCSLDNSAELIKQQQPEEVHDQVNQARRGSEGDPHQGGLACQWIDKMCYELAQNHFKRDPATYDCHKGDSLKIGYLLLISRKSAVSPTASKDQPWS